jgi:hypothetical protein
MSEHYDLLDIMNRLPVLQKAALKAIDVACDAVSYWPHQQESFPYWWNRIESAPTFESLSADHEVHRYQISMALVIAHLTEGYKGEPIKNAYTWVPAILSYFSGYNARHLIDGAEYTTMPDWLWTEEGGAIITALPAGTRPIVNSGIEAQQVAAIFTLEVPLLFDIS